MTYEIAALLANISLALSLIVALVFGVVQVRIGARDRRERLTLEALRNFQTREFAEMIARLSYHKVPSNYAELLRLPLEEQAKFIQFAQEMESLGMLVAEQYIKIDLVDKTLGSFVTTSWQQYKTIFAVIREKQSDPFLGEYFQWLAELIEERMQKFPRKTFYEMQ